MTNLDISHITGPHLCEADGKYVFSRPDGDAFVSVACDWPPPPGMPEDIYLKPMSRAVGLSVECMKGLIEEKTIDP